MVFLDVPHRACCGFGTPSVGCLHPLLLRRYWRPGPV